ncbi:IclR family transcriptional regulator [Microvirga sp. M2]|uniref:IclR family transcriptional regulator n=1 Tax=Microvirga sp. M2 TaxID=3073270 RepID=UPI0039C12EFC
MDKTLLKGLNVLEHVAAREGGVRITDIAAELDLTKSNAHRVLKTLEHAGYLRQDPKSREYGPSLKLWELGSAIVGRMDIRTHASDVLRRLANEARESVHLSVLENGEVIYIDKIDSPAAIGAYTRIGGRAPAYCVATGKAMLCYLPEDELRPILAHLNRHSKNTIVDPEELRRELMTSRQRGYTLNRGEWRDNVWGIATAIRGASSNVIAAIGVSGPEFHFDQEGRCEALAEMVMRAGREISGRIGYRGA